PLHDNGLNGAAGAPLRGKCDVGAGENLAGGPEHVTDVVVSKSQVSRAGGEDHRARSGRACAAFDTHVADRPRGTRRPRDVGPAITFERVREVTRGNTPFPIRTR